MTTSQTPRRVAETALAAAQRPADLAVESPRGRPTGQWGMFLFVATEATLFACLLASYFYLQFTQGGPSWPPGGIEEPKLLKPLVMTALLVSSSGPMIWADYAIRRGRTRQMLVAIALTIGLAVGFLGFQVQEYAEKLQNFQWTTNAYGSLFYTITGFHGFHVVTGLVMLGYTWVAGALGKFTSGRHERVRIVSIYWHFVDVVWLFIVFSLYLSPHLS